MTEASSAEYDNQRPESSGGIAQPSLEVPFSPQTATFNFTEECVVKAFSELSRETLQRRWQAINVLVRMNTLAGLKLELDASLELFCDLASEIVPYDCALVFFAGEEGQLQLRLARHTSVPSANNLNNAYLLNTWVTNCQGPLLMSYGAGGLTDSLLESVKAKSLLAVPLFVGTQVLGCVQFFRSAANGFVEDDARLLWLLSLLAEKFFRQDPASEALAGLAFTDFVTGLKSRRYFEEQLSREIKRAERSGNPLSMALIDIDQFKQINDAYGHRSGDVVLREVSSRLLQGVREIDTVARYGGDEFAIVLPETNLVGAEEVCQRVRTDIESAFFTIGLPAQSIRLTISIGAATLPRDSRTAEGLLEAADIALYEAKRNGRNRVVLCSELDLTTGKRLEQRICVTLPVRIWGMDINGKMFDHEATAIDVTTTGARLKGVECSLHKGGIVGVQHKISKARYRVVWVGAQGSSVQSQIGLRLIDTGKLIWGRVIPRVFGDDDVSPIVGLFRNRSPKSGLLSISKFIT